MENDYCSYELAKKLKECGFDEPCDHYYNIGFKYDTDMHYAVDNDYNDKGKYCCSCPLLYHAQKWLREEKGIDVLVYNCACGYLWEVSKATDGTVLILFDDNGDDENSGCWTSYECALSAGISAALAMLAGKEGEG